MSDTSTNVTKWQFSKLDTWPIVGQKIIQKLHPGLWMKCPLGILISGVHQQKHLKSNWSREMNATYLCLCQNCTSAKEKERVFSIKLRLNTFDVSYFLHLNKTQSQHLSPFLCVSFSFEFDYKLNSRLDLTDLNVLTILWELQIHIKNIFLFCPALSTLSPQSQQQMLLLLHMIYIF